MDKVERYRLITKYPKDEFFDNKQVIKFDAYEVIRTLNKQDQQIANLEAKITESVEIINEWMQLNIEKSAEIHQLKQQIVEEKNRNKKLNHEAQKYYEDAYCNGFQNKKAIEQLEKVKALIQNAVNFETPDLVGVYDAIDQQIAELKGGTAV